MITGNEPISARPFSWDNSHTDFNPAQTGLTIRQHFAAMAMQGLISSDADTSHKAATCAAASVRFADALIVELNKQNDL